MNSRQQKKKGYKYKRDVYLNAIVIEMVDGRTYGRGPYHNIRHTPNHIEQFMRAMKRQYQGAVHCNFYNSVNSQFLFQKRYQVEIIPVTKRKKRVYVDYNYTNSYRVTGYDYQLSMLLLKQWD